MLNVTAQKSADGAKAYFAKSDYYSEGQELIGHWGGKGAILLGLAGEVQKTAFDRLCDNQHPQSGEPLTALTRGDRRVGYDFTWSAPKSVSVVQAMTGDDRIMQAFRESVADTMSEMEAEMQTRLRKGGQNSDRQTGNWCYAEFIHLTSRPVNGVACPQLHAHCFAMNATFDPVEDKWKAGQFGKIKGDGYYWQAVQQARFANRLQSLGYSTRKTKDAFEIAGVPESVLKKYSLRTGVIERMAEKLGITDPKIKARLGATTREAKDTSIPYPDLVEMWDKWLTPNERQALLDVADGGKSVEPLTDDRAHVQFAAEHIFERTSVADERRLMTLALRHGCGEVTPEGVRHETRWLGLLRREENGKTLVTTKEIREEEDQVLGFASAGKGTCRPLAGDEPIAFADKELDEQQRRAVELPLRSADRVVIIKGKAGTGKTKLTREAVDQIEARGKNVVIVAPTTPAVGVLHNDGFDADTLARLLVDPKMQESARNGFIVLDEAGLVGSKSMAALFSVARDVNARVVLLGDTAQLASVERGAPLRLLEQIGKVAMAEVTEIRRQRSRDYIGAVKEFAAGKAGEGLDKLDAMGRVKTMPVWDKYQAVATDYADKIGDVKPAERMEQATIICATRAEGQEISQAVRDELRARGMIGKEEQELRRLVPLQWSEAERADRSRYDGTEVVQFHRNSKRFKAGERVSAAELLKEPAIGNAANFATYGEGTIKLARNDLIRTTAKGKTLDGKHTVGNGSVYMVKGFDRHGNIQLTNGWTLGKDFSHINHAYCTTDFGAQGRTVEHVFVVVPQQSYPAVNKRGLYVDVSRGRESATVYVDDKRKLREVIERDRPRLSATELAAKPRSHRWRRMRETLARVRLNTLVAAKAAAQELAAAWRPREYAHER
jgi:conjugative relaxase-like TrwC/TraI family protein